MKAWCRDCGFAHEPPLHPFQFTPKAPLEDALAGLRRRALRWLPLEGESVPDLVRLLTDTLACVEHLVHEHEAAQRLLRGADAHQTTLEARIARLEAALRRIAFEEGGTTTSAIAHNALAGLP